MKINLSSEEQRVLELQHSKEKDRRKADRIKSILLRHENWSLGKIAQAFIQGLADAKWQLFAYDPAQEALKTAEKLGATAAKDSFTAVKKAETVIVCTKPETILTVLDELSDYLGEKLVISVAAGVTTKKIFSTLNKKKTYQQVLVLFW